MTDCALLSLLCGRVRTWGGAIIMAVVGTTIDCACSTGESE